MKKQELIHLHGLLAEVQSQIEEWDGCTIELTSYEELGVRPTSIHKSKTDHKVAVFELIGGICGEVVTRDPETVPATAD